MTGDWEPEVDDIAAMRRENGGRDLKAFMRQLVAEGNARRTAKPARTEPPRPHGHRPGAWPPGTRPPERPPDGTTFADWQPALADIREHLRRNPPTDHPEETL